MAPQGYLNLDTAFRTLLVSATLYIFGLAFYRLFLSPIARVPGPRLAALTYWYEFYYDGWIGGRYLFKIKELHQQYGPIVRINPHEVHINDIDFYDTIYAPGGTKHPRDKIRFMATSEDDLFDSRDSEQHRRRRAAIGPPFSKQSIRALEPAIRNIVDELTQRLGGLVDRPGENVIDLHAVFNSLTQEVIGQYMFGTDNMSKLRSGETNAMFLNPAMSVDGINAWGRMFPWALDALDKLPPSVLGFLFPDRFSGLGDFDAKITEQLRLVLGQDEPVVGARNVFHEMRDGKHLPAEDRNFAYYKREAASILGGGTETTAGALLTTVYHVISKPEVLWKVREELHKVMPNPRSELPPLTELEALPYLSGVVEEGIRLAFAVPGRLPRIAPAEELVYKGYRLPAGTVLSSSSYLHSTNEAVFRSPYSFEPERWIGSGRDDPAVKNLKQNFVAFGRGARMCVGINLARAELFLTFAAVFSRLELEPYETTDRDVEIVRDIFIGLRPRDSKGVRAKVVRDLTKAQGVKR